MHIKLHKPLPSSMGPGQNVILSIRAAQSNGPMLAVPEAALFGGQDGKDYVSKVTGPTSTARISVTVVTEGDGLVGIRPAVAGALKPGDQVVTGENYLTSPHGGRSGKVRLVPGGSGSGQVVGPG
jgi:multidrug efflux pump subunit AcrA (membrane-fusion protein)